MKRINPDELIKYVHLWVIKLSLVKVKFLFFAIFYKVLKCALFLMVKTNTNLAITEISLMLLHSRIFDKMRKEKSFKQCNNEQFYQYLAYRLLVKGKPNNNWIPFSNLHPLLVNQSTLLLHPLLDFEIFDQMA